VPGADVRVGPAEELPFGDGEFDLVTCMGSLEHVAGPRQAVLEMRRVVRPGGRLLLVVPNSRYFMIPVVRVRQFLFPRLGQPVERHSSLGDWRGLFEACGLAVNEVHADNRLYLPGRFLPWLHESAGRLLPLGAAYQFAFLARPA
jgi:SAM-dependent methyltransferase